MKVYISASYAAKDRLRTMRDALYAIGHETTSTWLDEQSKPSYMPEEVFWKKLALKDLVEAGSADLLIQDTFTQSTTGGLHTEWGVGLARFQHQLLWVVGPTKNVFHTLADKHFPDWDALLVYLKEITNANE